MSKQSDRRRRASQRKYAAGPSAPANFTLEQQTATAIQTADVDPGQPARASTRSPQIEPQPKDPADGIRGMPPNLGRPPFPHVVTFQSLIGTASKTYRASDEALQHSLENSRFMRNDPTIMECLEARQRGVALLNWHLEPADAKSDDQNELCRKLTEIIEETPRFMQYRECLDHAIWYGRYANTHQWGWKPIGGQQRLCVTKWNPVHGDKLVFKWSDGSVGIRVGGQFGTGDWYQWHQLERASDKIQVTDYGMAYFLDAWERSLLAIHKHMIEDGAYEDPWSAGSIHGVGIRSRIYWCWYQKQECLAQLMEYLERSAHGIELWYYPMHNKEAEEKTRTAAQERIGNRNIVLVPKPVGDDGDVFGVEHIEPGLAGVEALERIVSGYFGHLIKRYILGQVLTSEAEATGLGSGVADLHLDTYLQIIRYDSTNLEETLTTDLVEPVKLFNFPAAARIRVKFKIDTESPDVAAKLEGWERAYNMGVKLKAQAVMDLIGAPAPDASDEVLQHPQFQQQAAGGQPGMGQPGQFGNGAGRFQPTGKPDAQVLAEMLGVSRNGKRR